MTARSTLSKTARIVGINIAVLVLLLLLLEGGASFLFITRDILRTPALAEQSHSTYDETLGWVGRPNLRLPDLYGSGVYLRTNAQGFRNNHDFARAVPPGKTRIVCSGDSFTLGFGVNNDQTWCQRLAALDPRLETVNMGQGGYGLDQAYLWYMRDGVALDHQLHLVAFITADFGRMRSDRFLGFGKPVLGLQNDSLVIRNRPVPRTSSFARWRAVRGQAIGNLNVVRLGRKLFRLDQLPSGPDSSNARNQLTRQIASRIFENLARVNREKNSRLVLVYLPGDADYTTNDLTSSWRRFVHAEAARQGILFLDLVEHLRRVPPTDVNALFAPNKHYSVAGNEWVAATLFKELATVQITK